MGNRVYGAAGYGDIYSWGSGSKGKLGHAAVYNEMCPRKIAAFDQIVFVQVSAGAEHTLALTDRGDIYSWGCGAHGKLGHYNDEDQLIPTKIEGFRHVRFVQISTGADHSVCVTSDGNVYTFGKGQYGKLGHGSINKKNKLTPTKVEALDNIGRVTRVVAGVNHTCAITETGRIYSWGRGSYGRLGQGDQSDQMVPKCITGLGRIRFVNIDASYYHTVAVTETGRLWSWGSGGYGKLGHGDQRDQFRPKLIESVTHTEFSKVATGGYHTIALTADGSVYTFGGGIYCQLGHGDQQNQLFPKKIQGLDDTTFTGVAAGFDHSMLLSSIGDIYTMGNGGYGKLGHDSKQHQTRPHKITNVGDVKFCAIAAGDYHSVALTGLQRYMGRSFKIKRTLGQRIKPSRSKRRLTVDSGDEKFFTV